MTFRSTTSSETYLREVSSGAFGIGNSIALNAIDTTSTGLTTTANAILHLDYVSNAAGQGCTFQVGGIELVKP